MLNLAVIRSEVRIAHKEYYGLDTSNNNVPDLSTEPALAEGGGVKSWMGKTSVYLREEFPFITYDCKSEGAL